MYPKNEKDIERDKKYAAFVRHDLDRLDKIGLGTLLLRGPFVIPRLIFLYHGAILTCTISWIMSLFKKGDKNLHKGWSHYIIRGL